MDPQALSRGVLVFKGSGAGIWDLGCRRGLDRRPKSGGCLEDERSAFHASA